MNPKHDALMRRSLDRLSGGTFDESDIRMLLLGIRENLTAESKRSPQQKTQIDRELATGVLHLLDISHSIAHPDMKSQGPIRAYVRSADKQNALALQRMLRQKLLSIDPVRNRIELELPAAIKPLPTLPLAVAFTRSLPASAEDPDWGLVRNGSDIEVCILSLLHQMQLPGLDEIDKRKPGIRRSGYLAFQTWQGTYRMYAGIHHSMTHGVLSQGSYNDPGAEARGHPYIYTLPVFNGTKQAGPQLQLYADLPRIVFAERVAGGRLDLVPRD